MSVVAASVRPWKPPVKAMTPPRPVAIRDSFSAPSTASAPELQKNTRGSSMNGTSAPRRSASSIAGPCRVTTDVWISVRGLALDGGDHERVAVADVGDADARAEVEEPAPFDVDDPAALAALGDDREVAGQHVRHSWWS